jgi:hypothetical protein
MRLRPYRQIGRAGDVYELLPNALQALGRLRLGAPQVARRALQVLGVVRLADGAYVPALDRVPQSRGPMWQGRHGGAV